MNHGGFGRRVVVALLSLALLVVPAAVGNPAAAVVPRSEEPLAPIPDGVWIRGTKVALTDTKQCWKKNSQPVLQAKVNGRYTRVANGKLVNVDCDPDFPYEARYRFTLKHGGDAKKLTLRSTDASGAGATFKRTVYSSMADYNATVAGFLNLIDEALNTRPDAGLGGGSSGGGLSSSSGWSGCYFRGQYMAGTVKVVDYGLADFTVKRVSYLADLRVKPVDFLASSCGEWKFVDYGLADFTVKFVDYGLADFSIQFVDFLPGRS